jgi:hypothetical protein
VAKLIACALVALLVYGCASSQLSRSRIDGYDRRPVAEREQPRRIFRPETHAALKANAERLDALAKRAEREAARSP